MAIKFRKMRASDVGKVFRFGKKYFGLPSEYSWDWSRKVISEYLKPSFGTGIIAADSGKIAGFALAQRKYSSQRPRVAWLTYIFVRPEYRHHELGMHLVEKMVEKLSHSGAKDVITDVYTKNTESIRFFVANGFKVKEKWFIMSRKI